MKIEMNWKTISAGIGIVVAVVGTTWGAIGEVRPLMQSEPAPLASVEHVKHLEDQMTANIQQVTKAQSLLVQAQKDERIQRWRDELRENANRRKAILRDIDDLHDQLIKRPNDKVYLTALDTDKQDLDDNTNEHTDLMRKLYMH